MVLNANLTNAITNALHAMFLFCYFFGAFLGFLKKKPYFSLYIVLMFFSLFFLKILGIYVHYYPSEVGPVSAGWVAISLGTILMNYFIVSSMEMPALARIFIMCLSVLSSFLFLTHDGYFTYLALPMVIIYCIVAYYSYALARIGFIMVVCSNLLWVIVRNYINYRIGYNIPSEYQYDNDIFHLLLIISTFILYLSILKGQWKQPVLK